MPLITHTPLFGDSHIPSHLIPCHHFTLFETMPYITLAVSFIIEKPMSHYVFCVSSTILGLFIVREIVSLPFLNVSDSVICLSIAIARIANPWIAYFVDNELAVLVACTTIFVVALIFSYIFLTNRNAKMRNPPQPGRLPALYYAQIAIMDDRVESDILDVIEKELQRSFHYDLLLIKLYFTLIINPRADDIANEIQTTLQGQLLPWSRQFSIFLISKAYFQTKKGNYQRPFVDNIVPDFQHLKQLISDTWTLLIGGQVNTAKAQLDDLTKLIMNFRTHFSQANSFYPSHMEIAAIHNDAFTRNSLMIRPPPVNELRDKFMWFKGSQVADNVFTLIDNSTESPNDISNKYISDTIRHFAHHAPSIPLIIFVIFSVVSSFIVLFYKSYPLFKLEDNMTKFDYFPDVLSISSAVITGWSILDVLIITGIECTPMATFDTIIETYQNSTNIAMAVGFQMTNLISVSSQNSLTDYKQCWMDPLVDISAIAGLFHQHMSDVHSIVMESVIHTRELFDTNQTICDSAFINYFRDQYIALGSLFLRSKGPMFESVNRAIQYMHTAFERCSLAFDHEFNYWVVMVVEILIEMSLLIFGSYELYLKLGKYFKLRSHPDGLQVKPSDEIERFTMPTYAIKYAIASIILWIFYLAFHYLIGTLTNNNFQLILHYADIMGETQQLSFTCQNAILIIMSDWYANDSIEIATVYDELMSIERQMLLSFASLPKNHHFPEMLSRSLTMDSSLWFSSCCPFQVQLEYFRYLFQSVCSRNGSAPTTDLMTKGVDFFINQIQPSLHFISDYYHTLSADTKSDIAFINRFEYILFVVVMLLKLALIADIAHFAFSSHHALQKIFSALPINYIAQNPCLMSFAGVNVVEKTIGTHNMSTPLDIFNEANISLIVISKHFNIVSFTTPVEALFGYKSEQLLGQSIDMLLPLDDEMKTRSLFYSQLNSLDLGRGPTTFSRVIIGCHSAGASIHLQVNVTLIDFENDDVFIVEIHSIDEDLRYEDEIIANTQLADKLFQMAMPISQFPHASFYNQPAVRHLQNAVLAYSVAQPMQEEDVEYLHRRLVNIATEFDGRNGIIILDASCTRTLVLYINGNGIDQAISDATSQTVCNQTAFMVETGPVDLILYPPPHSTVDNLLITSGMTIEVIGDIMGRIPNLIGLLMNNSFVVSTIFLKAFDPATTKRIDHDLWRVSF